MKPDFIYVDLDGVLADYERAAAAAGHPASTFKRVPGAYLYLTLYPGAREALDELNSRFPEQVWLLTKPPSRSPYAWGEKALWVQQVLGDRMLERLIITPDKSHAGTMNSILFDDRPHKGGVSRFRGHLIRFGGDAITEDHWPRAMATFNELVAGHPD